VSLLRAALLVALLVSVVGIGAVALDRRTAGSLEAVPDRQLLAVAQLTPEAQAFSARYPDATASIDRSGRVAVDFRSPTGGSGVRLRVFIEGPDRAGGSFFECPGAQLTQKDVADAIRRGCPG